MYNIIQFNDQLKRKALRFKGTLKYYQELDRQREILLTEIKR